MPTTPRGTRRRLMRSPLGWVKLRPAVAVGAGMICLPAGLIAGGVLAIAGAVLSSLGGGGER